MDFLAGFLIGMLVGASIGVFLVSLAVAAKRGDDAFNVPPPVDRDDDYEQRRRNLLIRGYDFHEDGYVNREIERRNRPPRN